MKIAIIGYSGCGKSTLAKHLSQRYHIPVLYLDSVYWLPNWRSREQEEGAKIVRQFLDTNDSWVIEGNYTSMEKERRMREADQIIFLSFNRFSCLYRAFHRYFTYRGQTRESMGEGCKEKIDLNFVWWILHAGRTKAKKQGFQKILKQYPEKCTVIKNQRQLTAFMNQKEGR